MPPFVCVRESDILHDPIDHMDDVRWTYGVGVGGGGGGGGGGVDSRFRRSWISSSSIWLSLSASPLVQTL